MKVLVTGGAGFIGSHTVLELFKNNHDVLVYDNFSNSSLKVIERMENILKKKVSFLKADLRDKPTLKRCFEEYKPESVIHFAGYKAVGDSVEKPIKYYDCNVQSTICLLDVMNEVNCNNIVFSSSATVYKETDNLPYTETHACMPASPYGRTKYFNEQIIDDWVKSNNEACAVILRYFNPVGAHSSGMIGEDPLEIPNNLMPYISQVAIGKIKYLNVFGSDYSTRDGTGERDYIHVIDLASAHISAIDFASKNKGIEIFNIGTGNGTTVLELAKEFSIASGIEIPINFCSRRKGDVAASYADCSKANKLLNWRAKLSIKKMCTDSWHWQSLNPKGYDS